MMSKRLIQGGAHRRYAGISLIEVTIASAIVGVLLVAALNTVGATAVGRQITGDRARAGLLGEELMAEILSQDYADLALGPGSWGIGADEVTGNRSKFDDVDDYDGWFSSPPQYKDGGVIDGYSGWSRSVGVDWVSAGDLLSVVDAESGIKRIVVVVKRGDMVLSTLRGFRTFAMDELSK